METAKVFWVGGQELPYCCGNVVSIHCSVEQFFSDLPSLDLAGHVVHLCSSERGGVPSQLALSKLPHLNETSSLWHLLAVWSSSYSNTISLDALLVHISGIPFTEGLGDLDVFPHYSLITRDALRARISAEGEGWITQILGTQSILSNSGTPAATSPVHSSPMTSPLSKKRKELKGKLKSIKNSHDIWWQAPLKIEQEMKRIEDLNVDPVHRQRAYAQKVKHHEDFIQSATLWGKVVIHQHCLIDAPMDEEDFDEASKTLNEITSLSQLAQFCNQNDLQKQFTLILTRSPSFVVEDMKKEVNDILLGRMEATRAYTNYQKREAQKKMLDDGIYVFVEPEPNPEQPPSPQSPLTGSTRSQRSLSSSSVHAPSKNFLLQPRDGAGVAGGTKFSTNKILFKFPFCYFYQDDFESGIKVGGHELLSIIQLYNLGIKGLYFPDLILMDYLGFRILAISELPIDQTTIVYGSANADKTNESERDTKTGEDYPTVLPLMEKVGHLLHLKKHKVSTTGKELITPIDVEVHIPRKSTHLDRTEFDGKVHYVIDFSRLFPPQAPRGRRAISGQTYLYELLRPELVHRYYLKFGKRLSPDAFSRFEVDQEESNRDVEEASDFLMNEVIDEFVFYLSSSKIPCYKHKKTPWNFFVHLLHRYGINCRHLGAVFTKLAAYCPDDYVCSRENSDEENSPNYGAAFWRRIVLIEIVSRFAKCKLRQAMHTTLKSSGGEISAVIDSLRKFLNNSFGYTKSFPYWFSLINTNLADKFQEFKFDPYDKSPPTHLFPLIINNFCSLLGIKLPKQCLEDMKQPEFFKLEKPFSCYPLREFKMKVRLKVTTTAGASLANNLRLSADNNLPQIKQAMKIYTKLLRVDPNCWHMLMHMGDLFVLRLNLLNNSNITPATYKHFKHHHPDSRISSFSQYCKKVEKKEAVYTTWAHYYYKLALEVRPCSLAYARYGNFLWHHFRTGAHPVGQTSATISNTATSTTTTTTISTPATSTTATISTHTTTVTRTTATLSTSNTTSTTLPSTDTTTTATPTTTTTTSTTPTTPTATTTTSTTPTATITTSTTPTATTTTSTTPTATTTTSTTPTATTTTTTSTEPEDYCYAALKKARVYCKYNYKEGGCKQKPKETKPERGDEDPTPNGEGAERVCPYFHLDYSNKEDVLYTLNQLKEIEKYLSYVSRRSYPEFLVIFGRWMNHLETVMRGEEGSHFFG